MGCKFDSDSKEERNDKAELIDTWWNVNTWKQQEKTAESQRINRYIVECKSANRCNFKRNVFHRYSVALVQL